MVTGGCQARGDYDSGEKGGNVVAVNLELYRLVRCGVTAGFGARPEGDSAGVWLSGRTFWGVERLTPSGACCSEVCW